MGTNDYGRSHVAESIGTMAMPCYFPADASPIFNTISELECDPHLRWQKNYDWKHLERLFPVFDFTSGIDGKDADAGIR